MQKGFIKLILLIVIGLIVLKFLFKFDVIDYIGSQEFTNFTKLVWEFVVKVWNFIIDGILFVWEEGTKLLIRAIEIVRSWFE